MRTQFRQCFLTRGDGDGLHVAVADEINDGVTLSFVIFDDKEVLDLPFQKRLD